MLTKYRILFLIPYLVASLEAFGSDGSLKVVIADRALPGQPLKIIDVAADSAEARAGIKPQSFLIAINNINCVDMSLAEALNQIHGQVGTFVTLDVADAELSQTNQFTFARSRSAFSTRVQSIIDQHDTEEARKRRQEYEARRAQATNILTRTICYDSPIPKGWIKVNIIFDAAACPTPTPSFYNEYVIRWYEQLPINSTLEVCVDAPIPEGWVLIDHFSNYSCGCAQGRENNMKLIKRIE
ncbi:MAG TPA: hypothetical protein VH597_11750 [Verrucomicrobiae bacterium]|jgi:hypothetical protein|nr:hypothetical protein [Verrucomicrobiae bacterium]